MKSLPFIFYSFAALASIAVAQEPTPPQSIPRSVRVVRPVTESEPGRPLPENYVLSLAVKDKDHPVTDLTLVVADKDFKATTIEPYQINFNGTVVSDDKDGFVVRYKLSATIAVANEASPTPPATPTFSYRTAEAENTVRLKLDEPLQIVKMGDRTYQLTISRPPAAAEKSK